MRPERASVPWLIACLMTSMSASAQDFGDAIDLDSAPVMAPIEIGSGWYLRGDIGTSVDLEHDTASFQTYSAANGLRDGSLSHQSYLDDEVVVGVGAGYRFNDVFRADGTFDFMQGSSDLSGVSLDTCSGAPSGTSCNLDASSSFSNYQLMANAYFDLATISGFTPYIGAGLGFSYIDWDTPDITGNCVGFCGANTTTSESYNGASSWRSTYSLMAGVSYELSDRLSADIGYRFSDISSGRQWSKDDGSYANDGGFERHEIRFGIRFLR